MESFWKWLMQANARGVFAAAVAALLLVSGWWVWRELAPGPETSHASGGGGGVERPGEALGLLAFLDANLTNDAAVPADPFLYGSGQDVPPNFMRNRQQTDVKPPSNTGQQTKPATQAEVKPPPPRPPRPPVEKTSLTYRGLMRRTDGKVLVLIEDSKTKKSAFRKLGDAVSEAGVQIKGATEEQVIVADADGNMVPLPFGTAVNFADGRHAN